MENQEQKRIILIEDDDLLCSQVNRLLGEKYQFSFKQNIADAEKMLLDDKNKFDLIIADIMLPKDQDELNSIRNIKKEIANLRQNPSGKMTKEELSARMGELNIETMRNLNLRGGIDILLKLRKYRDEEKLSIPIIYFTVRGEAMLKEEGINLVQDGKAIWLDKPVSGEEIVQSIQKLLNLS